MRFFKPIIRQETNIIIEKIARRKREKSYNFTLSEVKENINHGLLYQNENKEWRIATKDNSEEVPYGRYVFVRTITGFTRVAPSFHGAHSVLAGYRKELRYAGEVIFDENGHLIEWNNCSGAYKPLARLFMQAGLPAEKFAPEPGSQSPLPIKKPIEKSLKKSGTRNHLSPKYQCLRILLSPTSEESVSSNSNHSDPISSPPRLLPKFFI